MAKDDIIVGIGAKLNPAFNKVINSVGASMNKLAQKTGNSLTKYASVSKSIQQLSSEIADLEKAQKEGTLSQEKHTNRVNKFNDKLATAERNVASFNTELEELAKTQAKLSSEDSYKDFMPAKKISNVEKTYTDTVKKINEDYEKNTESTNKAFDKRIITTRAQIEKLKKEQAKLLAGATAKDYKASSAFVAREDKKGEYARALETKRIRLIAYDKARAEEDRLRARTDLPDESKTTLIEKARIKFYETRGKWHDALAVALTKQGELEELNNKVAEEGIKGLSKRSQVYKDIQASEEQQKILEEELKNIEKERAKALDNLAQKSAEATESASVERTSQMAQLEADARAKVNTELDKTAKNIASTTQSRDEEIKKIAQTKADLDIENRAYEESSAKAAKTIDEKKAKLDEYEEKLAEIKDAIRTQLVSYGVSTLINAFKKAETALLSFGKTMLKTLGRMTGVVGKTVKNTMSLQKAIRLVVQYGFGFRSLYYLVRRFRSGIVDGFGYLANYAPEVKEAIDELKNSFTYFKAAVATALQPLLNVVIPVLRLVVEWFSLATRAVATFFATLTGQSYIYTAKKDMDAYAESTDKAAGSTKKLTQALGAYDRLNVIQDSSRSGSGSGAGLDDFGAGMFDKENYDPNAFALMVKEAWETADFTPVGEVIGAKLKEAFDSIDWDYVFSSIERVATSFATFINGLISTENLGGDIGSAIANVINGISTFINTYATTIDWSALGNFISEGFNSFFSTFDATLLGESIHNWVDGMFTLFRTTIEGGDGVNIVTAIGNFFRGLDVGSLLSSLSELVKSIVTKLREVVKTINWTDVGNSIADALNGVDWQALDDLLTIAGKLIGGILHALGVAIFKTDWSIVFTNLVAGLLNALTTIMGSILELGGAIAKGLLQGILSVISGIGKWIKESIFDPFIKGFKEAFGIHSPSKVMAEMGDYVAEGFLNGIKSLPDKARQLFTTMVTTIKDLFKGIPDWFKSTFSSAWEKVKAVFSTGSAIFTGIKEGIENTFRTIVNKIISGINTIITKPFNKINSMLNTIRNVSVLGVAPFSKLWSYNPLSVPQIPYLAQGAVIPPNSKFLAMLGDQTHGTNIEAPLDTIKQAVAEVLGNRSDTIVLQLDGKTVAKVVWDENEKRYKQTGRLAY